MRILAVIPGEGHGNSYIFARRQAQSLADVGMRVDVFYLKSRTSPVALIKEWWRLRRKIAEFSPHIVHAHYGTVTSFVSVLSTSLPIVITFRGSDLDAHPSMGWVRGYFGTLLSQISILMAQRIVCVSERLRERLWWGGRKAVVIPTGVNLGRFHPIPVAKAREELGWGLDERMVLFCGGTLPAAKGSTFVQAAVRRAQEVVKDIRLFVLDGSISPDDVPIYLNAADCLAFASFKEGSPNIVKEALACNLPIVSVDVGDVRERLKGVFPSMVVRRDVSEFSEALVDLLKARNRSNGQEKVVACSEERVALDLCSLYRAIPAVKIPRFAEE
jgi:glycosyltransferase involved in cell wall biosynthesis